MESPEETVELARSPGVRVADFPAEVRARLAGRGESHERYELKGEVARGGQGAVLRVWDRDLHRTLAMKVVLEPDESGVGSTGSKAKTVGRFLEEAQVTSQLDHPGVVPVHELGVDAQDRVYFTMKLVKGEDLSQVFEGIREGREGWSRTRALGVLLRVCEAMAYAHSKKVVHRDLKPANIMVGRYGETYVMDWGLARVMGVEDAKDLRLRPDPDVSQTVIHSHRHEESACSPLLTMDGDVVGTPAYMSPEQARGDLAAMGPASDVYSVGCMLYHLLAGHAPYTPTGSTLNAYLVWGLVQNGPPRAIAEVAGEAPGELVAICEKAMAREPDQRYADMGELADDLRAFLEDRVVRAYRTGALVELRKWVRRNRSLAATLLALVVLTVGGSVSAAIVLGAKNDEVRSARDEALAAQAASEKVTDFLVSQFESLEPDSTRGQPVHVEQLLTRAAESLEEETGEGTAETARLRAVLGRAFYALGLYPAAEPLLERALQDRRQILGEEDPLTLASLDDLAVLLEIGGRYAEAESLQTQAFQRRLAVLGEDHPDTLTSMSNLAYLYESQGSVEEAERLYAGVLEKRRAVLGADHLDTLIAQDNLALLYELLGRYEEAEPLMIEALEGFRATVGEAHPNTLTSLNNLALLYGSQERFEEAEELYSVLLEQSPRVLGEDHPDTLDSKNNLAGLHVDQGRYGEAERLYTRVLEKSRALIGEHHPDTLTTLAHLAELAVLQGRTEEAQALFVECLEARREVLGEDHAATLETLDGLARLYADEGRWGEAGAYARRLLELTPEDDEEYPEREELLVRIEARTPD